MNCLQFRRLALSDPHHLPADAQQHRNECVTCRGLLEEVLRHDRLAAEELRGQVREGLEQRVLLAYRLRTRRRWLVLALAASLLVTLVVGGFVAWRDGPAAKNPDWIAVMGERLEWDPLHLRTPMDDAPHLLVDAVVELGGRMDAPLLNVIQVRLCKLGNFWAAHLVMEIDGERVVAFLLPQALPDDLTQMSGWKGRLSSRNGGSICVFARHRQAAEQALRELEQHIRWT